MSAKNLKAIIGAYPEHKVLQCDSYKIGTKVLVTENFLADFYEVHKRSIHVWRTKGLKADPMSLKNLNLYNLVDVLKWHNDTIVGKSTIFKADGEVNREANLPLDEVSSDEADRRKKIEEVKKMLKINAELSGSLVKAEDLDRGMAEQAVIHKGQYMDDLVQLPSILEKRSKGEIANFLEQHYQKRMQNISTFIHKTFDIPDHFYTEINKILNEEDDE